MSIVRFLRDVDASCIAQVGGKGANLGELVRAGFPVPAAFCITTDAYERAVGRDDLIGQIISAVDGLDYDDVVQIEAVTASIRERILHVSIPGEDEREIADAYALLEKQTEAGLRVSVRSSATAEDLPGMSFAGQQDTYLDIRGIADVLASVKRCWASLWNARAVAYRHRQGFAHRDVQLAVVVQAMFPSEVAGVMFTVNPVNSNPAEIVINTSWGLGEAIVSGRVDPDRYVVRKVDQSIVEREIKSKLAMTVMSEHGKGAATTDVPADRQRAETLSEQQIRELAGIGARIEAHYGWPQDIEWGLAGGRFAILQSREVTAADIDFRLGLESWQTPRALEELDDERWVWSRSYSDELQTGPSTPFMYTGAQPHRIRTRHLALDFMGIKEFAGYQRDQWWDMPYFRWYGARAYYNLFFEKEWIRRFIPPFARDEIALFPFPAEMREEIKSMPFNWFEWLWTLIKLEFTHPYYSLLGATHHLYDNFEKDIEAGKAIWANFDFEGATVKEILTASKRARDILRTQEGTNLLEDNVSMPFNCYLYWLPHGLQRLCETWCGDATGKIFQQLTSGLKTKFAEQNRGIWMLSRAVKASPVLSRQIGELEPRDLLAALAGSEDGRRFRQQLDAFLEEFGQGGAEERDPVYFRWSEKPERVFPSITALLPLGEESDPNVAEEQLHARMLRTKAECMRNLRQQPYGALKAVAFKLYVEVVQDYFYYRDWERFQNNKNMLNIRPMLHAIARKFIARGYLDELDDIFFVGVQEIPEIDDGKYTQKLVSNIVRGRRVVY